MKLLGFFLTVVCLQSHAVGLAQEKVSLQCQNVSLKQALTALESRSSYRFLYHDSSIASIKDISIQVRNESVLKIVDQLIAGTPLHYRVTENNLIVLGTGSYQPADSVVKGKVTDDNGQPVAGVSIHEPGSKGGTMTNDKGEFSLHVHNIDGSIEISSVGYISQRMKIGKRLVFDIRLKAEDKSMQDVVVVGSQQQSKKMTTAAVSSISGKAIENMPSASVDAVLQGRIPGLNVQVSSGEPGVAPTIVVRGNTKVNTNISNNGVSQAQALSSPLYIIDGMPVNPEDITNTIDATGTNYLAGININDIETVDVQKDAAATAAWGSRGANGVIYIKTRRGRSTTPEFRVNTYGGLTERPKLLKTYTGAEERRLKMQIARAYGTSAQINSLPQILTDSLNPYYNNATDWQGLFYRGGAIGNVDASMSAATNVLNYRLSMNYYDEKGIIKQTGYKRYGLRGNFDFRISPKLNSQFIVSLSKADRQRGRKFYNSDENTPFTNSTQPSSFYLLTAFDSANFTGLYSKLRNQNTNDFYSAAITTNYTILPELRYTFQGSANVTTSNKDYFQPSNIDAVAALSEDASAQPSYAESDRGTYSTYFLSNNLTFSKKLELGHHSHEFVLTGAQQFTSDVSNGNSAYGYNVPSNDIQIVSGIPQSDIGAYSYYAKDAMLSYMGQLQYDLDSKYLLYGSYRWDASSRFGDNSKWGSFPAIGAGWIVTEEKFMDRIKHVVNFLKIRGSWGISGSQSSDFYAPYNSYTVSGTYGGSTAIQPSYTNGLTKNNLTWAKTTQKDIGLDAQFFNNRLYLNLDIYDKISRDDYYNFSLPFYTGYSSVSFNAHDLWVSNRGLDLSISTHNLSTKNPFQWNSQLVLSFNKNRIAKLPNHNRTFEVDDYYGIARIFAVGQPIYQLFQMKYGGVYNKESDIPFNPITGQKITYFKGNHTVAAGDPIWKDVNGDYDVWTGEDNGDQYGDRVPTGNPNPLFTGGFTNDLSYKNFSLTIVSVFTWKRTVVNTFFQQQMNNLGGSVQNFAQYRLPDVSKIDYWTPAKAAAKSNYQAGFPSINPFSSYYYQFFPFSDMWNVDGSYFKIKYLIAGYQIPRSLIQRLKIKNARLYGMVDNVLIIKNKRNNMPDPEAVDQLGVYTGGLYPQSHKFTFGLDIQF